MRNYSTIIGRLSEIMLEALFKVYQSSYSFLHAVCPAGVRSLAVSAAISWNGELAVVADQEYTMNSKEWRYLQ